MTNRTYEIAKRTAGKYLAPVLTAGVLAFSGCGKQDISLPINQETRENLRASQFQELESRRIAYSNDLYSANNLFNRSIESRSLDIETQTNIYTGLATAKTSFENYKEYAKKINALDNKSIEWKKSDNNLYKLLDKNLNGADFGTPELEKALRKDGLDIEIECTRTETDNVAFLSLAGSALTAMVLINLIFFTGKKPRSC